MNEVNDCQVSYRKWLQILSEYIIAHRPTDIIDYTDILLYNAITQNDCFVKGSHNYDVYLVEENKAHLT